jgi:AAA15 family ATPase/GTPase
MLKEVTVMDNMYYLLNVTVAGVKCIEEEIRLDFYKKIVNQKFDADKYRIKAIYGENGSGKSAIITAVKIFQDIICNSQYLSESKNQKLLDELINKKTQHYKFKCEFLCRLEKDNIIFAYELQLKKNESGLYEIVYEKLSERSGNYSNSRYKSIYEVSNGKLIFVNAQNENYSMIEKMTYNLLGKSSFLNIYFFNFNNFNKDTVTDSTRIYVRVCICMVLAFIIKVYLDEEDKHELYFIKKVFSERIKNDNNYISENVLEIMDSLSVTDSIIPKNNFDIYVEKINNLTAFLRIFKHDLKSIEIDKKDDGDNYRCDLNLNYGDYLINKEFESTGIKKLIKLYDCFDAASKYGIVFIDEMDSNLNDVYLCKIIEYFMYYGKGQLCFTTHNLDPMSVLKENKYSIDFLSSDNKLVSWVSKGNATPDNYFKNGMIENIPFNIDATDFIGVFGE